MDLETAQANLEARREKLGVWIPPETIPAARRVRRDDPSLMVECFDCGEEGTWSPYPPSGAGQVRICPGCADSRREHELRDFPREEVLRAGLVPDKYRRFDALWLIENEGGWPADIRRNPPAGKSFSTDIWDGDPRMLTLAGPVGNGKSTLAAQLALRCYRSWGYRKGLASITWVRASTLLEEHFDDSKPRTKRALYSPITVLDEVYGRIGQSEHGFGVMEEFIARRWERHRQSATILTTNRPVGRGGEKREGGKLVGPASIERIARPVFDRLLDGVLVWMRGPSGRGKR